MSSTGGQQPKWDMTASSEEGQVPCTDASGRLLSGATAVGCQQKALRLGPWPIERLCLRTGLSGTLATLSKALVLCRGAEVGKAWPWILLGFFHKQRHARLSEELAELTGHFLRGAWRLGESQGVKPKVQALI